MNKLKIIRNLIAQIVEDIDTGNSNIADDEYDDIISQISMITQGNAKYSKYQAMKYLKMSRATFDNYVRSGAIHAGRKQLGFKELFWLKADLDEFIKNNS